MKKVVLFFESVYPDNNAAAVRASYLLKAFKAKVPSIELVVLTGTSSPASLEGVGFVSLTGQKSYKKISSFNRALKELKQGFSALFVFARISRSSDFIYISSPSYLASLVLICYSILTRKPFVFEVRDIYPEAFVYAGLIKEKSLIYKFFIFLSRIAYKYAELNVPATEGIKKMIEQSVLEAKNITCFNGFPASFLGVNNIKFERFTLVFHGTLGSFQDIEMLCELSRRLEDFQDVDVFIIGHGPKSELVERLARYSQNIKFFGSLNYKETIDVVSKCHIGLSLRLDDPLSSNSFPVKIWEYIGLAIPSIITPWGSEAGRFLELNCCGVQVKGGDVDSIIDTVAMLKSDAEYYKKCVENCKRIRILYTRERLSEILVTKIISNLKNR